MTVAAARARRRRGEGLRRSLAHPVAVWIGFVLAHLWLGLLGLYAPGQPLGDVATYRFWVEYGAATGQWVGLQAEWVYPLLALVPMLASAAFGPELFTSTWLSLVMLLDAAAFATLLALGPRRADGGAGRSAVPVAWWWVLFLVVLGPVAVGRIDAVLVALGVAAVVVLARAPGLAGVLLAIAAWIKVWPAALVAGALLVVRRRLPILVAAVAVTAAVLVGAVVLGGAGGVLGFLGAQGGRGVQIEAVVATPWLWHAVLGGGSSLYYDGPMLTFQLRGPGVPIAAAVATPLLAAAVLVVLALGAVAWRRGAREGELLAPLLLALTTALIVFNKVGSPQFAAGLAIPVVLGLVIARRGEGPSFRTPAVLALAIAALTQVVYPYLYLELLRLDVALLVVLSARNALYLVLLGWAVWRLAGLVAHRRVDAPALSGAGWRP